MPESDRTDALFADAWTLYDDAIEMLDQGKVRNAAEKAWGATKRATDALVLARTGREPRSSGQTMRGIRALRREDPDMRDLATRCGDRASALHGRCFYDNDCEPEDVLIEDIRETADYIRDAEAQAGHQT